MNLTALLASAEQLEFRSKLENTLVLKPLNTFRQNKICTLTASYRWLLQENFIPPAEQPLGTTR